MYCIEERIYNIGEILLLKYVDDFDGAPIFFDMKNNILYNQKIREMFSEGNIMLECNDCFVASFHKQSFMDEYGSTNYKSYPRFAIRDHRNSDTQRRSLNFEKLIGNRELTTEQCLTLEIFLKYMKD